jgi:hypothetical protein
LRETDHNRGKQDRPHFIRKSKRDTFEVLGKETDMYKCRDCKSSKKRASIEVGYVIVVILEQVILEMIMKVLLE